MREYDVAVLGGGPGGYVAALRASMRGAKACCIEAGHLGGTCLNVGCIPTKAMLHASELLRGFSRSRELGFTAGAVEVDDKAFMARVEKVVAELRKGVEMLLKARKVDVIRGRGRLAAGDTILVETDGGEERVKARSIIIATGAKPARPDFLPWDSPRIMTTDEATTAKELPRSVVIIGGGVIGCEFATVYSELGIPTTVVEMLDSLAPELDSDASRSTVKSLQKRGVTILTGSRVVSVDAGDAGVAVSLADGQRVEAACALVAVGRIPNTEGIGLEAAGLEMDGKVIRVDDRCRTNVEGLYAVGDVATHLQYAHLASRMGIIAADNATGHEASDDRQIVPVCMYTHPEAAAVGLAEPQAREKCPNVRVAKFPYMASGMARAYGETEGMVKLIGDPEIGEILGAVVIGQHASDTIQEIATAMRSELTFEEIANTIHPHPTFVEGLCEAAEAWLGMPLHSPG